MTTWGIVVAAGSGTRFGRPKQFERLAGRTALSRAVGAARSQCQGVVVVLPRGFELPADTHADVAVVGGETRCSSVRAGLAAVPAEATVILVHDATRPLASPALFAAVVDAVREGAEVALPAVPLADSIRRVGGGAVDRHDLLAVQTPQGFAASVLRQAHAGGGEATDDATLAEQAGADVHVVPGEVTNLKLTHPSDLRVAEVFLAGEDGAPVPHVPLSPVLRIGHGFDVHRFSDEPGRPLVLGGVRFADERGLVGHSDTDAIAHAVTDALLGAAGLGDIGQLFPDDDPTFAGADSLALLAEAVRRVRAAGWATSNVDCTVMTEAPKLAPRRAEIEERLSAVVGAPVSVKGKRAEGLGALGRREGLACWAVASLSGVSTRPDDS